MITLGFSKGCWERRPADETPCKPQVARAGTLGSSERGGSTQGRQGLFHPRLGSALLPQFPCLQKAGIIPLTDLFQPF